MDGSFEPGDKFGASNDKILYEVKQFIATILVNNVLPGLSTVILEEVKLARTSCAVVEQPLQLESGSESEEEEEEEE